MTVLRLRFTITAKLFNSNLSQLLDITLHSAIKGWPAFLSHELMIRLTSNVAGRPFSEPNSVNGILIIDKSKANSRKGSYGLNI